jgi:hypothetical protein
MMCKFTNRKISVLGLTQSEGGYGEALGRRDIDVLFDQSILIPYAPYHLSLLVYVFAPSVLFVISP